MPRPDDDAVVLGQASRLDWPLSLRSGPAGERLGRGTGASLEFQDRQHYVPGDDVRHLDWRAYARTDQLLIRVYREEVMPRLELLVDGTRSMATAPDKAQLAVDLAAVIALAAESSGFQTRVFVLGFSTEPHGVEHLLARGLDFEAAAAIPEAIQAISGRLRPGTLRILVSDFLFPHEARALVRPLAMHAGGFGLACVLSKEDADPPVGRASRLVDAESEAALDRVVDDRLVARYLRRLERLQRALEEECTRAAGRWLRLEAGQPIGRQRLDGLGVVPA